MGFSLLTQQIPSHVNLVVPPPLRKTYVCAYTKARELRCAESTTMVLADLGRKITTALRSLGNATVINEEVRA